MPKKVARKCTKRNKKIIAPIVIMACRNHKDYKAIYPPKTDCLICWKIYATNLQLKVKMLKVALKELKNAKRR